MKDSKSPSNQGVPKRPLLDKDPREGRYIGFYVEDEILEEIEAALRDIKKRYKLKSRSAAIKEAIIRLKTNNVHLMKKWENVKNYMGRRSSFGEEEE